MFCIQLLYNLIFFVSMIQILSEIWRQNSLILRVSYELAESMLNETWTLVGHFVSSPTERERKGTDEQVDEKREIAEY